MDKQMRDDMESMAEWAATQDAWERLYERRARRRERWCFWHRHPFLTPWPCVSVEHSDVAAPTSEDLLPQFASGVGSGASGTQANRATSAAVLATGNRLPERPHPHS